MRGYIRIFESPYNSHAHRIVHILFTTHEFYCNYSRETIETFYSIFSFYCFLQKVYIK